MQSDKSRRSSASAPIPRHSIPGAPSSHPPAAESITATAGRGESPNSINRIVLHEAMCVCVQLMHLLHSESSFGVAHAVPVNVYLPVVVYIGYGFRRKQLCQDSRNHELTNSSKLHSVYLQFRFLQINLTLPCQPENLEIAYR